MSFKRSGILPFDVKLLSGNEDLGLDLLMTKTVIILMVTFTGRVSIPRFTYMSHRNSSCNPPFWVNFEVGKIHLWKNQEKYDCRYKESIYRLDAGTLEPTPTNKLSYAKKVFCYPAWFVKFEHKSRFQQYFVYVHLLLTKKMSPPKKILIFSSSLELHCLFFLSPQVQQRSWFHRRDLPRRTWVAWSLIDPKFNRKRPEKWPGPNWKGSSSNHLFQVPCEIFGGACFSHKSFGKELFHYLLLRVACC